MTMIFRILSVLFLLLFHLPAYTTGDLPADVNASQATINLYRNLKSLAKNYVMVGHQDALAYGVTWRGDAGRSDIKDVCGSHPAVYGWDIGELDLEAGGVTYVLKAADIRKYVLQVYKSGGVNTISWHLFNPVTGKDPWADTKTPNNTVSMILPGGSHHSQFMERLDRAGAFLASLRDESGQLIPIVFRPWHEHTGNWFWWGQIHCTPDEYIQLFRFTILHLRQKHGLNNLLVAYSPYVGFNSAAEYLEKYPGDDMVDVFGVNDYTVLRRKETEKLIFSLETAAEIAAQKGKIAAFTEAGSNKLSSRGYFSRRLLPVLSYSDKTRSLSWVLFWRNAHDKHYFVPYAGHKASRDFINFVNDPLMLMQNNIPDLYRAWENVEEKMTGK